MIDVCGGNRLARSASERCPLLALRASALSQLKVRVARFGRIGDSAWHKEVCHAEEVRRTADGSRAQRASRCYQEAQGDGSEGATCSDFAEGGRRRAELDRRADRRGVFVSDQNG